MPTMSVADFMGGSQQQPPQRSMRSEDEARNIIDQMEKSSGQTLNDSDRQNMMTELQKGADVNLPGLVSGDTKAHKLQPMSTDEFLGNSQPKYTAGDNIPGMISAGNIDLSNRPIANNSDGTISTVRSISISEDGKSILIPTVVNGKVVSNQEAINHYHKTGENLGVFKSDQDADAYAQQLHEQQAKEYEPDSHPQNFMDALQDTRENSLNSLKRVYQGIKDKFTDDSTTIPGRKMTPEEFDVYKKLGYTSNAKSAIEGLMADSVDDLTPAWGEMSGTPSSKTLANLAAKVKANPEMYKDKPGIMDYLAGKIDSQGVSDFLSHLDNPNKLILEGSLPSNFIQTIANSKDQERYRYDQVQSVLNAKKILAKPDAYTPGQVSSAQAVIKDFDQKTSGKEPSTLDKLKEMKNQVVKHPAEAAAGLVNSLVQDPELLGVGGLAGRGTSIATRIATGGLEGAALNTVISAAQQSKDISGKVDEHELGASAALGLGLGATLGTLRRGEAAYKTDLNTAKLDGTYEQIIKDRAAHDAIVEDALKQNSKVPTDVKKAIEDSLGIQSNADREKYLSQRRKEVKDAFKNESDYADYLQYLAEEKQTRHEIYMKDLEDARARHAADTSKSAEVDQAYEAARAETRSRRQEEFDAAVAARDEALRAKDHEAALAENDRLDSLRHQAEQERLEDVYGQNHPVVRNAQLAADRSDRAARMPKWQRGNVDPELLKQLGIRAGLITAGSAAGAYLYPENRKAGAILGGAAGLLLPAGGEGVKYRRGQSGAIGGLGARTADFGRLKDADALMKAGKSADEIYDQTGWYQGVDGKWKFEIPDTDAKLDSEGIRKAVQGFSSSVGAILDHPKLFEAYPELADVEVSFQKMPKTRRGSVTDDKLILNSNPDAYAGNGVAGSLKAVILHELQHVIQKRENFGRGGSADQFLRESSDEMAEAFDNLMDAKAQYPEDSPQVKAAQARIDQINKDAFSKYMRLAGEVEARNVQRRLTNRDKAPFLTEDTPAVDQIVSTKDQRVAGAIGGLGARTADFGRLKDADALLNAGKSADEIYDRTGWYQGVDGKWKFEIPDTEATLNPAELLRAKEKGQGVTVGDVLNHDKLFEAYPNIAKVKVRLKPMPVRQKAMFVKLFNRIILNSDPKAYAGKGLAGGIKATLLHELQHYIQTREDFARGANARAARNSPEYANEVERLTKNGQLEESAIPDQAAFNVYRRHAGEVEARNVQTRIGSADARSKAPFHTEDTPANDQIVRTRESEHASSEELPQNNKLQNEQKLVSRAKDGDQKAFTKLYNHFAPQLKRFATSYVREAGPKLGVDAGELAHIALAKGLMHLDQFSGDSSLSTWLHAVLKNEGLQLIRTGQSRIDTTSMFVHKPGNGPGSLGEGHILEEGNSSGLRAGVEERMADHETPDAIEAARETEQMLNHALRKVPENTRQAVKMFLLDGMSQEEIAQAMGVPQQTVSTLVFRGKKVLQDTIEKELGTDRGTGKYPSRRAQAGSIDPALLKKMVAAGIGAGIGAWLNKKHPIWGALLGAGAGLVLHGKKDAFDDLDKAIMPMSTRIKNKSEAVHFRLKEYYRVRNTATHDLIEAGNPFLQALHKLPKHAQALLERSILTGDRSVTDKLIDAIGNPQLKGGWEVMRTVLDGLGDKLLNMKMIKEKNPDYFPRIVKDKEGLFAAIGKAVAEPMQKMLDDANREALKKTGNPLTDLEQSDLINKYLAKNYKGGMSQRPGYSFARRFEEIPEELQPFYANLAESYHSYVRGAVKNIELAKFFGKNLVSKEEGGINFPDLDKSIGQYVNEEIKAGKMSSDDVKDISDQIRAMFGNFEKGGNKTLQGIKNTTLAGFLGNPLAAVSQITTPIVTTYLQGLRPTVEGLVRKLTGKQIVTAKDFGLADHMSEEFVGTTRSAKFLRKALKWGTFRFSDLFDKDIKLNAAVIKARQLAKTPKGIKELEAKYKDGFGERFPDLVEELKKNKMGDNTKALAYGELSRSDPIDPVEFSQFYADNPNGRNLLALKSYMLKQMDLIRRDAYNEIKKGNRAKGIKNLMGIGLVMGLSGMAAQDVQNFMLGRPVKHHPSDLFVNMLKTFGWSEYASRQAMGETKPTYKNPTGASKAKGKLFQTVGEAIAPPIPYKALDDLWNRDPNAVAMIPVVGRFLAEYYKNRDKTPAQRKKEAQEL